MLNLKEISTNNFTATNRTFIEVSAFTITSGDRKVINGKTRGNSTSFTMLMLPDMDYTIAIKEERYLLKCYDVRYIKQFDSQYIYVDITEHLHMLDTMDFVCENKNMEVDDILSWKVSEIVIDEEYNFVETISGSISVYNENATDKFLELKNQTYGTENTSPCDSCDDHDCENCHLPYDEQYNIVSVQNGDEKKWFMVGFSSYDYCRSASLQRITEAKELECLTNMEMDCVLRIENGSIHHLIQYGDCEKVKEILAISNNDSKTVDYVVEDKGVDAGIYFSDQIVDILSRYRIAYKNLELYKPINLEDKPYDVLFK